MRLLLLILAALSLTWSSTSSAYAKIGEPCARAEAHASGARAGADGTQGRRLYAQARYLDASTGRFLSLDPVAGALIEPLSTQGWTYADAMPTRLVDRDGRDATPAEADARDEALIETKRAQCALGDKRGLCGGISALTAKFDLCPRSLSRRQSKRQGTCHAVDEIHRDAVVAKLINDVAQVGADSARAGGFGAFFQVVTSGTCRVRNDGLAASRCVATGGAAGQAMDSLVMGIRTSSNSGTPRPALEPLEITLPPSTRIPAEGVRLNAGSGKNPMKGAINFDLPPKPGAPRLPVDLEASAEALPFKVGSVTEIHSINPYGYDPVNPSIAAVLKTGGKLYISATERNPHLEGIVERAAKNKLRLVGETAPGEIIPEHQFGNQTTTAGARGEPLKPGRDGKMLMTTARTLTFEKIE